MEPLKKDAIQVSNGNTVGITDAPDGGVWLMFATSTGMTATLPATEDQAREFASMIMKHVTRQP